MYDLPIFRGDLVTFLTRNEGWGDVRAFHAVLDLTQKEASDADRKDCLTIALEAWNCGCISCDDEDFLCFLAGGIVPAKGWWQ